MTVSHWKPKRTTVIENLREKFIECLRASQSGEQRAMQAMLQMRKLDIAALQRAYAGE